MPDRVHERTADQAQPEHGDAVEARSSTALRGGCGRRGTSTVSRCAAERLPATGAAVSGSYFAGDRSAGRSGSEVGGTAWLRGGGVPRRRAVAGRAAAARPCSSDLGVLLQALRSQPPEGGPFVIASVDDEFFVIARQDGPRIQLLLSDLTASVEYPLAEQVLDAAGRGPARRRRARRGVAGRRPRPVRRPRLSRGRDGTDPRRHGRLSRRDAGDDRRRASGSASPTPRATAVGAGRHGDATSPRCVDAARR